MRLHLSFRPPFSLFCYTPNPFPAIHSYGSQQLGCFLLLSLRGRQQHGINPWKEERKKKTKIFRCFAFGRFRCRNDTAHAFFMCLFCLPCCCDSSFLFFFFFFCLSSSVFCSVLPSLSPCLLALCLFFSLLLSSSFSVWRVGTVPAQSSGELGLVMTSKQDLQQLG